MHRSLFGYLFVIAASFPVGCSPPPPSENRPAEIPTCIDYSAREFRRNQVAPEGAGHAVRIYFLDATDTAPVRVMMDGKVVLDRPLELNTDGTGISGGLICRLPGSMVLSVAYEGRETQQTINVVSDDAKIIVHPVTPSIELVYGPLLLD